MKLRRADHKNHGTTKSGSSQGVWHIVEYPAFVVCFINGGWSILARGEYPWMIIELYSPDTHWLHAVRLRSDKGVVLFATRARALDAFSMAADKFPPGNKEDVIVKT